MFCLLVHGRNAGLDRRHPRRDRGRTIRIQTAEHLLQTRAAEDQPAANEAL